MPYIKSHLRVRVDAQIDALAKQVNGVPESMTTGVLNYAITRLLRGTVLGGREAVLGPGYAPANYHDHNEAMGVLECIKLELYRRLTAPYEDEKILTNGDV